MSTVTPDLKKETTVPQIPEPTPGNLLAVVKAIKEVLEVREGITGDPLDQLLTARDLYAMGLLQHSAVNRQIVARLPGYGVVFFPPSPKVTPEYAPPPAPTGFTADGALANVILTWNKAAYHGHAYTEVWRAGTDNFTNAVLVGTTDGSLYADNLGQTGATRYYWIRYVSQTAVPGPFNATAGTVATTGFIVEGDITDASITTEKLADGSVVTVKLGDLAVTSTKIGDSQVTEAKIGDAAVTTNKVGDSTITAAKIGDLQVTETKLVDGSVSTAKLGDSAVTTQKIGDSSITKVKFGSGLSPVEKVSSLPTLPDANYPQSQVVMLTTDNKLYRSTGSTWTAAVPTVDLTGQITEPQIADAAVTSNKVGAAAIELEKFAANLRPVQVVETLPVLPHADYPSDEAVVFLASDRKLYRNSTAEAASVFHSGTAQAGGNDALVLAAGAPSSLSAGSSLRLSTGPGSVQERPISAYDVGAKVATVSPRWRTNLLLRSEEFDNASWGKANVTVSANAIAGSDGEVTADKLIATAATTQHRLHFDGQGVFPAGTYTLSVEAKAGELGYIGLTFYDGVDYRGRVTFDLATGAAVVVSNGVAGDSENLGNGWWRLSVTGTTTADLADANGASGFWPHSAAVGASNSSTGDGTSGVYIRGAQFEEVSALGDYIKTVAAAITLPDATTDYEVHYGAWTAAVQTTDLIGQITETQITDSAISTPKLAANAVTATKIAAGTITSAEIAAGTIVAGNIAAAAIGATEIAANAVVADKIAANAVVAGKLAAASVAAGNIATNAIIAGDGVIATAAIGTALIQDGAIVNAKIGNLAVDAAKIADAAIVNAKIADATIDGAKIANATIGDAKITNLSGTKITAASIAADKLSIAQLAAITADMGAITAGTVTLNSTGHIKSGQTAYNTGVGFWLGIDSGDPKFSIGDAAKDYLRWDPEDGFRMRFKTFDIELAEILSMVIASKWRVRTTPKNFGLQGVVWNGSIFCAVGFADGFDAYLITSPNGVAWTERANPKNIALQDVCWSSALSLFIAVGNSDGFDTYLLTSPTGTTWTERSNPKAVGLLGCAAAADVVVAVGFADGSDAYLISSTNGTSWTERSNPKNIALQDVCYSPELDLFVAVGNPDGTDAYIVTSPDGVTWTERSNPKNSALWGVTWSPELGLFVAVGSPDGTDSYIVTSPNGSTWTERSAPKNKQLNDIVWNGSIFVACGNTDVGGDDAYMVTSSNGIDWTEVETPQNRDLDAIEWNGKTFVAVGQQDATDPDGGSLTAHVITSLVTV